VSECFSHVSSVPAPGPPHEADEGAAGEEPDERVPQEPRDRVAEERPAEARGPLRHVLNNERAS